jgi:hypothetical protein
LHLVARRGAGKGAAEETSADTHVRLPALAVPANAHSRIAVLHVQHSATLLQLIATLGKFLGKVSAPHGTKRPVLAVHDREETARELRGFCGNH